MQINWNPIKLAALTAVVTGLYAFSNERNAAKKVTGIEIEFIGDENLYITQGAVNKLLIQNFGALENVPKENLALNTIEKTIQANKMVKTAQVYLTVDGELATKIIQRKPVGRVEGDSTFYLDEDGEYMPLSASHSARVPIITGEISGKALEDAYTVLDYINTDDFLRKNVIGIHIKSYGRYQLRFRTEQFTVNLGGVDNLKEKFDKFKAFYAKANKDKTLDDYDIVSLEFNNQVVCSKI